MSGQAVALCFFLIISLTLATQNSNETKFAGPDGRKGKVFSLFNVVQFKNEGCRTNSALSGSRNRNGTCFTSSECASKGGTASGNCAAGFGVCCLFLLNTANSLTVSQNCTYIQNPGFPTAYTSTGSLQYTVNKVDQSVCRLRLDFETFTIVGPGASSPDNIACMDMFTVTSPTSFRTPVICGQNTGQHIYVETGRNSGDSVMVAFTFSPTAASPTRMWDIKVTQLPCASAILPPEGCLQYHVGQTGRFRTFNFDANAEEHLISQDYSVCIRQEAGFCCVQYQVCADQSLPATSNPGFSLDGSLGAMIAAQNAACILDYIEIAGSSGTCDQAGTALVSRFCGRLFVAAVTGALVNTPVCDCTPPFKIDVFTDAAADAISQVMKGVCLEWFQVPCN